MNKLIKISFKSKFNNLNYLSLINNKLEEIQVSNNLPNIEYLLLNENALQKINLLSIKSLKTLNLSDNQFDDE